MSSAVAALKAKCLGPQKNSTYSALPQLHLTCKVKPILVDWLSVLPPPPPIAFAIRSDDRGLN